MKTPWTLLLASFAMTLINAALLAPFALAHNSKGLW